MSAWLFLLWAARMQLEVFSTPPRRTRFLSAASIYQPKVKLAPSFETKASDCIYMLTTPHLKYEDGACFPEL